MRPRALSAHIGYLFSELPLEDRVAAAARAGFEAVEHPNPRPLPPSRLSGLLRDHGLSLVQMAAGTGDASRGEKGLAALPGREAEFREDFLRCLDYAEAVGCRLLHPMAGIPDGDPEAAAETYRGNLGFAADRCRGTSVSLIIEAISHAAVPGYHIATLADAVAAADAVSPAIDLLLDTFHCAAVGEDPSAVAAGLVRRLGHVHIADYPGRHEPGTGALELQRFLSTLVACGYSRAIGFEYVPSGSTITTLGWMDEWRALLRGSEPGPDPGRAPPGRMRAATHASDQLEDDNARKGEG